MTVQAPPTAIARARLHRSITQSRPTGWEVGCNSEESVRTDVRGEAIPQAGRDDPAIFCVRAPYSETG